MSLRPVTIEDGRVVTHGAPVRATFPPASPDYVREILRWHVRLCEGGEVLYLTPADAVEYREMEAGVAALATERDDLAARLATAETALADRDRHFMWDDRLRMEREIGDLATRLATAEAERDQWQRRAEWLSTSTDEVCYVEPVGDYEGGWHILAVRGFYATRWEAIDAATRRAPSTGGTP